MSTPRRSSRIKAKAEDRLSKSASLRSKRKVSGRQQLKRTRNVLESSSEEEEACHELMSEEEGEEIDLSNLISPVTRKRRPNNFFKVYNTYNFDRDGIDTYEKDFIDDSHFQTPQKRHPKYKRKGRTKRVTDSEEEDDKYSSNSSDDVGIRRTRHTSDSKRRVLNASSSDSEGDTPYISPHRRDKPKVNKEPLTKREVQDTPTDSDDEDVNISVSSAKRRKKMVSLNSDSDEDNLEDDVKKRNGGISKRKRRRLLKQPESDDEISMVEPSVRGSSGRAMKLQKEKERERQKKLRRLKASRGVKGAREEDLLCSGSQSSDEKDEETPDEYGINDQEVDAITEEAAVVISNVFTPTPSTAEKILFPVQDEGSSEEEESDWIVSSEESGEEIEDITTVLAQLRQPAQPIMYHFEAGCRETEQYIIEGDGEECDGFMELDTLLPLHEILRESGARGWRGEEKDREEEGEGEGERGEEIEKEDVRASAVARLRRHLPDKKDKLETVDSRGYTAVMVAADQGDTEALELLLEAGANINCRDSNLTTPLHLAALSGWVECVEVLISCGHPVDCRDNQGWPPLLYAHFQGHHECVFALMKANPKQLSVLRDLLRRTQHEDPEIRRRTVKVVRSLLMSLAHHETYYSIFNEFVGQNPSVLDEDGFSFMKHCMALLSFENKQAWLRAKLQKLSEYARHSENQYSSGLYLNDLTRGQLLNTVQQRLSDMTPAQCWIRPPSVSFKGEPGICTGPRREFWACLCQELASGGRRLFTQCDEGHLSLQPCSIFSKYFPPNLPRLVLEKHKQLLRSVGSLMACAVFHQDTLSLSLSKPLLKQLGGLSLNHPDDLQYVDQAFHHSMTIQLEDIDIADLELTFTQTLSCPWSGQTVDVAIKEGGRACVVSQQNKEEYIKLVSQFKLERAVEQELEAFLSGFWEVIPQKCLNVFSPDELSLLISGVPSIDVEDWSKNTQYQGLSPSDDIVIWFWRLIRSLKEEEKALLLKFATGSPRAPAGGFSTLQGLGGPTKFQVCSMPGVNKIPQASTCFNMLKLSDYSCEQELRNKILIAIRYGCEGFAFS